MTTDISATLHDILDKRSERELPVVWTYNANEIK